MSRPESPAEGFWRRSPTCSSSSQAPAAGQVPFLRAGLTAYVLAFTGRPPSPQKVHAGALERMRRGEPIVCRPAFVERSAIDAGDDTDLALSFFAFLATQSRVPALQRFLPAL